MLRDDEPQLAQDQRLLAVAQKIDEQLTTELLDTPPSPKQQNLLVSRDVLHRGPLLLERYAVELHSMRVGVLLREAGVEEWKYFDPRVGTDGIKDRTARIEDARVRLAEVLERHVAPAES